MMPAFNCMSVSQVHLKEDSPGHCCVCYPPDLAQGKPTGAGGTCHLHNNRSQHAGLPRQLQLETQRRRRNGGTDPSDSVRSDSESGRLGVQDNRTQKLAHKEMYSQTKKHLFYSILISKLF